MNLKRPLPVFGLLLGALSFSCQAFTLSPISATLEPKGYGASTGFRLENESSNRVAFQITMVTREPDETGDETQLPATNLFTVFPPQGIIAPGQKQNIRLVWKGPSNPTNELSYRIVAEELPVDFQPAKAEKAQSHIQMLVRYKGTVYVRPKNAKPQLRVMSLAKTGGVSGNSYELVITNAGNAHQGLRNPVLSLTDTQGHKTDLSADQLPTVAGENILARHTRRFLVTLPPNLKEQDYHAQIHVED
jgi:fimbrial chaperone protein